MRLGIEQAAICVVLPCGTFGSYYYPQPHTSDTYYGSTISLVGSTGAPCCPLNTNDVLYVVGRRLEGRGKSTSQTWSRTIGCRWRTTVVRGVFTQRHILGATHCAGNPLPVKWWRLEIIVSLMCVVLEKVKYNCSCTKMSDKQTSAYCWRMLNSLSSY